MKRQTSKGDQMQASKRGWKSLVITRLNGNVRRAQ
jgi:hypothetical protein